MDMKKEKQENNKMTKREKHPHHHLLKGRVCVYACQCKSMSGVLRHLKSKRTSSVCIGGKMSLSMIKPLN